MTTSKNTSGLLLLALLFGVAAAIRLFGIDGIPMDFHPTKQFRSAITTRAYYYQDNDTIEHWRKEVAQDNLERIGVIVPTLQERLIAKTYLWMGDEALWIGRLLSSAVWLMGGLSVFAVARRISSEVSALLGTSFYLLAPFGVLASQSFQVDPVMIGVSAISVWLSVRYHSAPSPGGFVLATFVASVAVLLKPVAGFIVIPAFVGAGFALRNGQRRLRVIEIFLLAVLVFIPTTVFYLYQVLLAGFDDWHRESSVFPGYVLEFPFWDGWLKRIRISIGHTYFLAGLIGALFARPGLSRHLLSSLWIGYFTMCLVLSYKISTHDYYHLPALLISALSITQLVDPLCKVARDASTPNFARLAVGITLAGGLLLAAGTSVQARRRVPDFSPQVAMAQRIGEIVSHSRSTIFLVPDYGHWLMYYGELSGVAWPYWHDIRDEGIWGGPQPSTHERFDSMVRSGDVAYFIVADLDEYARQSDLRGILEGYPVHLATADFLIYDLGVEHRKN